MDGINNEKGKDTLPFYFQRNQFAFMYLILNEIIPQSPISLDF